MKYFSFFYGGVFLISVLIFDIYLEQQSKVSFTESFQKFSQYNDSCNILSKNIYKMTDYRSDSFYVSRRKFNMYFDSCKKYAELAHEADAEK